ncbi:hypothetical protein CANARDRAFT_28579 [[Candida] arabinofermentans NRRL YB-2248]|uniref:Small-subunit processome Utp12 domain-containing protein n=1 Tax=[Candida] arabinofermentans NRRL YB-2248 TaxID=983967 RepID=A0A1E4T0S9_9ASCO|nr:hypothetical protein CANARDRAFT_28579 [[Candida] arabinofermentans NRRL YB-2248]
MSEQPLVTSAFDTTGQFFASIIVSLDSHTLRVQSTSTTTAFSNVYPLGKGVKVNSLSWLPFSETLSNGHTAKKQRKLETSLEDQLISLSLDNGSIYIYSPSKNELLQKLTTPNHTSNSFFHYSTYNNCGYGGDLQGYLFEYNISNWQVNKTIKPLTEDSNVTQLLSILYEGKPHLLLGSHSIQLIDPVTPTDVIKTLPGHISPIHSIIASNDDDTILTAAKGDRFVNAISISRNITTNVFVSESPVLSASYVSNGFGLDILVTVTEDGVAEVFLDPFAKDTEDQNEGNSSFRRKRKLVKSKTSNFKIQLQRPTTELHEKLPLQNIILTPKHLTITWLEDSSIPFFESLEWWGLNETSEKVYKITQDSTIIKPKPNLKVTQHSKYGHDVASSKHYNESHAIIASGDNFKDLQNVDSDNEEDDDNDEEEGISLAERLAAIQTTTSTTTNKTRANTGTLTVVLSQALKANDHSLLETVLNNKDETIIRNTVAKLETTYVLRLLERLAERISRNGNRQLNLNYWIKHILIFHGGYLINYPNLNSSLSVLSGTLKRKAATLDRLLELKGKVGMIIDRIEVKRDITKLENGVTEENNEEDEAAVEYIEELDDAGLLDSDDEDLMSDDGEGASDDDDDMEDDDEEVEEQVEEADASDYEDDEQYSDVEVESNGVKINHDVDINGDEDAAVIEKVKALKKKRSQK